jgi:hypothetical protein
MNCVRVVCLVGLVPFVTRWMICLVTAVVVVAVLKRKQHERNACFELRLESIVYIGGITRTGRLS